MGDLLQVSDNTATLTVPEAAHSLRLRERKLRELLADGSLRSFKIGRRVLIPVAEINAFIARSIAAKETP